MSGMLGMRAGHIVYSRCCPVQASEGHVPDDLHLGFDRPSTFWKHRVPQTTAAGKELGSFDDELRPELELPAPVHF